MDASFNSPVRIGSSRFSDTSPPLSTPSRATDHVPLAASDRYIADRPSQDPTISHFLLTSKENAIPSPSPLSRGEGGSPQPSLSGGTPVGKHANLRPPSSRSPDRASGTDIDPYRLKLARTLFTDTQTTVLGMHSCLNEQRPPPPTETERFSTSLGVIYGENRARNFQSRTFRVIAQTPEKILDAPQLINDYYLNLMDWSCTDVLVIGLGSRGYLWRAETGGITILDNSPSSNTTISSVSWHGKGHLLAIGLDNGTVQLWDCPTQTLLREIHSHRVRVASLSWADDLLACGSRDNTITLHDMRDAMSSATLTGHSQEVCGLRWSGNRNDLASGGNDNKLLIWDRRRLSEDSAPLWCLTAHRAAVKALSWNPARPHVLASGGGTADRTLRFWNTAIGECLQYVNTQSQVCGLLWNHVGTEVVSSHGFGENQLTIWKYPTLSRLVDLRGHTSRVLHIAMSPDGEMVASAAADETVRFWRCFPPMASGSTAWALDHDHGDGDDDDDGGGGGSGGGSGFGCDLLR